MKNYKKIAGMVLIALLACIPLVMSIYAKTNNNNFSCDGEITIQNLDETYNVVMHYRFNNGIGNYIATGVIQNADNSTRPISKSFTFHYTQEGDNLTLLSNEDINSSVDTNTPDVLVPDFFRTSGRGLSIRLKRENLTGALIILGNTPVFYCKRSQA